MSYLYDQYDIDWISSMKQSFSLIWRLYQRVECWILIFQSHIPSSWMSLSFTGVKTSEISLTLPASLRSRGVGRARRLLVALEQLVHFALDVTGGHREPLAHAVAGGLKRTDGERMSAASLSSPAPADADVRRSAVISPVYLWWRSTRTSVNTTA